MQWIKFLPSYNDSHTDVSSGDFDDFIQTNEGGYAIVTSYTHTMYIGETWFVKTDSAGNLKLNKTVENSVYPVALIEGTDGYTILSSSPGRGGSGGKFVITKLDSDANTLWFKLYGDNNKNPYATCGAETSDGGYIMGGYMYSPDVSWVVKADAQGDMNWNATYSFANASKLQSIAQAKDGGFIFVGTATSNPIVFDSTTRALH